jgi:hypothetical protein
MAGQDPIPTWLNLHTTVREPVTVEDLEPVETVVAISADEPARVDLVEFRILRDLIGTVPNVAALHYLLRFGRLPRSVMVNLTDGIGSVGSRASARAAKKRGIGAKERGRIVAAKVDAAAALEEQTGVSKTMAVPIDPGEIWAWARRLIDGLDSLERD